MIVSPTKGFIFVHIPKTAGTSMTQVLKPYRRWQEKYIHGRLLRRVTNGYSYYGNTHAPIVAACSRLSENQFSSMLKFTVVRHPVDWNLSVYRWVLKWRKTNLPAPVYSDAHQIETFTDYLQWRIKHGAIPQLTQLVDCSGNILVDRVCRLESLETDIAAVFNELGIKARVPVLNTNPGSHYTPNDEEIDLVMNNFADDFKAFGYTRKGLQPDWQLQKDKPYPMTGSVLANNGKEAFDPWTV